METVDMVKTMHNGIKHLKTMKSLGVKTILTMIALGIGVASYAQQSGRDLDKIVLAIDNATVQVDTASQTTKTPTTPFVDFTYNGGPLSIVLYDEQGSFQDGDWSLINTDSVVMTLNPDILTNFFYTTGLITDEIAGQDYTVTVRVNSETNGSNGTTQTFTDEFDYYSSDITVTYRMNGQNYTVGFRSPNSATGHVFDWEQPIPFYEAYSLSDVNNPVQFQDAMVNLGDLFDSESDTMDVKVDQRNVNNSNWAVDELLLATLSANAGTTTEPYPELIITEMIDFSDKSSNSTMPGTEFKYSSSSSNLDFEPPINDNGPHVMDTASTWTHTYTVPVPDTNTMPAVTVTGLSDNMTVDSTYIVPTDDPLVYKVHLVLKGGSDVSEENFEVGFMGIPVSTVENSTLDNLALKYGPNPFSNNINMSYNLDGTYDMNVNVYNTTGQLIQSIDLGSQAKGEQNFSWSPENTTLADGMYIFHIDGVNNKGKSFRRAVKTMYHSGAGK